MPPRSGPCTGRGSGQSMASEVTTPAVIVPEELAEEPSQVPFVEDDDLVQALAANASDHALDERVLPGTARGGERFFDARAPHARSEGVATDGIAIAEEVARRRLPGERLGDL